jgi:hypothetical protein
MPFPTCRPQLLKWLAEKYDRIDETEAKKLWSEEFNRFANQVTRLNSGARFLGN